MTAASSRIMATFLLSVAMSFPASGQGPLPAEGSEIVVTGKVSDKDQVTRTVNIGDLNLATDEGAKEMQKRVAAAVDDICAIPSVVGYYRQNAEKPCRDEGWASAQPQMDRALEKARGSTGN